MRRRKIRKFADRQAIKQRTKNISNTEATLILCGYSGERANFRINGNMKILTLSLQGLDNLIQP